MSDFLVGLGLAVLLLGLVALGRGGVRWARIASRRVGAGVLAAGVVVMLAGGALVPGKDAGVVAGPGPAAGLIGPYGVLRVVDGDTIHVAWRGDSTLRLIGMDTPETRDPRKPVQCFGREASARAHRLLDGRSVYLEMDPSQGALDKYGRSLAYVWIDGKTLYNKEMIAEGYAHEYTYDLPYKYQQEFKAAEAAARAASRGLWSSATCGGDTSQAAAVSRP